jgi:hypothetical protein
MPPPGSGLPATLWPDPTSPCPAPPLYGVLEGRDASELFFSTVLCWCVTVAIFFSNLSHVFWIFHYPHLV